MARLVEALSSKLAPADVTVISTRPRAQWLVIELMAYPDRRLFAKLALPEDQAIAVANRPRLVPVIGEARRLRSEADALTRLAAVVPADDPDLAAISVVHREKSPPALVVDWVDGQPLSAALGPLPRLGLRHDPGELLRRSGRWLNLFHTLSNGEPEVYRYPDDVLKWLQEVDEYLGSRPSRWAALLALLSDAVEHREVFNPHVAIHHGDMAARNLMVRTDGRIVGIDAGVEWQAPRSHDLAVFLTDLEVRSPHRTRRRVPDFIEGYGYSTGESWTSLIFRGVALVDRYLAWLARVEEREGALARRSIEGARLNHLADVLRTRLEERRR